MWLLIFTGASFFVIMLHASMYITAEEAEMIELEMEEVWKLGFVVWVVCVGEKHVFCVSGQREFMNFIGVQGIQCNKGNLTSEHLQGFISVLYNLWKSWQSFDSIHISIWIDTFIFIQNCIFFQSLYISLYFWNVQTILLDFFFTWIFWHRYFIIYFEIWNHL